MSAISLKTAFVAVFLFLLACGGDDGFEPAPGASIELAELDGLIDAALADFELERASHQPERPANGGGGSASCFEVVSGACSVPPAPEVVVSLIGESGARVLVGLTIGIDSHEAGNLVRGAAQSRGYVATETLRVLFEGAPVPASRAIGPCEAGADRESDEGCAWQRRNAPDVGDEARAMESDSLEETRLSSVAFAREWVFADVQVRTADGDIPNHFADEIAKALDRQIKEALSR